MKKRILHLMLICLVFFAAFFACGQTARASYMSNKTEIPVNLEVSGAEALCQTEDGYVWIAQYYSVTSRFQKNAISRSPYYVDALMLYGMMDLLDAADEGQKTFWADVALEEPDITEVLKDEEKTPTAEEEAQMEEEKLQEDLEDAA